MHAEHHAFVPAPAAEVFAFLLDGRNNGRWRSEVVSCTRVSICDEVGTIYRQVVLDAHGRPADADYRITALDPPNLIAFEVIAGPERPTGTLEVTDGGDDTSTVRFSLDLRPRGGARLLAPVSRHRLGLVVRQTENLFRTFART